MTYKAVLINVKNRFENISEVIWKFVIIPCQIYVTTFYKRQINNLNILTVQSKDVLTSDFILKNESKKVIQIFFHEPFL